MTIVVSTRASLLAAALLAAAGCAQFRRSSDDCESCGCAARALYHGELADDVVCGDGLLSQAHRRPGELRPVANCGCDCARCGECCLVPLGLIDAVCERPAAGPAPVCLRPEMPPKFLPVPTEPTLSPVRPEAPEPVRGDVEVGYRPQLTFPGRD